MFRPIAIRNHLLGGLIWLISALLVGCTTVGPDYREPDLAALGEIEQDLYGVVVTVDSAQSSELSSWWLQYQDPTLTELIEIARQENPSLRIAGLRVVESRALAAAAGATLYPQVQTVDASVSGARRSEGPGKSGFRQWSTGLSVGWELDFWGRFERIIESADAAFENSLANQRDAQVLLAAAVAETYWQYRTVEHRIDVLNDNADRQKRSYDITRQMFEAGQQSELDLQQARTQYLSTLASLPALQLAEIQLRNALAVLLGRVPGDIPELNPDLKPLPLVQQVPLAELPALLIQRRPDVRAALWAVAAQSAQIGVAQAEYYPAIGLGGSLLRSGNSGPLGDSVTTLGLGSTLSWTVFDWGRIANNIRVQDARLQLLIEQYRSTVLSAAREINDAVVAVEKTAEQRLLLEQTVAASERALELASARYREGYADFQRVLDAQRVVFSQADRKLQNDGAHLSATVALFKALGGGWRPDQLASQLPQATLEAMAERTDWGDLLTAPVVERIKPEDDVDAPK